MSNENPNKWTVMVYLAGDNNLAEEMVYALTMMQEVGSNPPDYEVCTYFEGANGPAQLLVEDPRGTPLPSLLEQAEGNRRAEAQRQLKLAKKESGDVAREIEALKHKSKGSSGAALPYQKVASAFTDAFTREMSAAVTARVNQFLNAGTASPGKVRKGSQYSKLAEKEQAIDSTGSAIARIVAEAIQHHQQLQDAEARQVQADDAKKAAREAVKRGEPAIEASVELALQNFILRSIEEHPAEKYMLVLSGHGSGAVGDFLTGNSRFTGLSIPELGNVLKAVQKSRNESVSEKGRNPKIDILGLDSCLMGTAEVAYEVRDCVAFMVGAEGFEPNTGWPYDLILKLLQKEAKTIEAKEFAIAIVKAYNSFYRDYTLAEASTDMSAFDLSRIEAFARAFAGPRGLSPLIKKALEQKHLNKRIKDAVLLTHWEVQDYKNEQHVDVHDFCDLLQNRFPKNDPIAIACGKVIDAIESLVLASGYVGPAFQYSKGLSIYFPWANVTDAADVRELDYYEANLSFGGETRWPDFLRVYHEATQRPVNPGKDPEHSSALNRCEGFFTGPVAIKSGTPAPGGRSGTPAPGGRSGTPAPGGRSGTPAPGGRMSGVRRIASMKNPPIRWRDPA